MVVFYDVWEKYFWNVLKHVFPSKNKCDRIIITTRNTLIANSIKQNPFDLVQELKPWALELAWELFCKKAFPFDFGTCCPQDLERLSREIIR